MKTGHSLLLIWSFLILVVTPIQAWSVPVSKEPASSHCLTMSGKAIGQPAMMTDMAPAASESAMMANCGACNDCHSGNCEATDCGMPSCSFPLLQISSFYEHGWVFSRGKDASRFSASTNIHHSFITPPLIRPPIHSVS